MAGAQLSFTIHSNDEVYANPPEVHRFQIPEGCHWRDVRKQTTDVGQALQSALRGIEQANPRTLYNLSGDAQWTNRERLSDALLHRLVGHFSRLPHKACDTCRHIA